MVALGPLRQLLWADRIQRDRSDSLWKGWLVLMWQLRVAEVEAVAAVLLQQIRRDRGSSVPSGPVQQEGKL